MILSIFLLLYNVQPFGHVKHYALIWSWNNMRLLRILPTDEFVLVDGDSCFLYENSEESRDETYVPAIRLDNHRRYSIWHYRYLLEWIETPPLVVPYSAKGLINILNEVSTSLQKMP